MKVVSGEYLGTNSMYQLGKGVYLKNNNIYACTSGEVKIEDNTVSIFR